MQTKMKSQGNISYRREASRILVMLLALISILLFASSCARKASPTTRVTVAGEASLKAQPDAAVIVLAVVTQSSQALPSQQENARKSDAVIQAVKESAGSNPEIKTSDYSLQPQYDYRDNQLPKIIGYEARNTVSITMSDLNGVGKVIDAASHAGANSVERIAFILRDTSPARGQALATATEQALAKAESIAQAMGGRVTHIVEEQEAALGGPPATIDTFSDMRLEKSASAKPTPIQFGALNVISRVQLVVEVEARL
jgi:uncharacterized protein YggE